MKKGYALGREETRMANEEQVALLRQGVAVWNKWREKNSDLQPDLTGASLPGVNLYQVNLSETNLFEAYLSGADLRAADLSGAELTRTDISGAHLNGADLGGARLLEAFLIFSNFRGANLHGANLAFANLSGADLRETNLSEVSFNETVFGNTNLTGVTGLDSCAHLGPSVIDPRTLLKSGRLPLAFLRGCGLPDTLINYLPSLLNEPLQFYSCFISYSTKDQEFAERLHADLQNNGVRCWFAPEDLKIGDKFRVRIDESIRIYGKLLLILSEHSIASDWVEKEVETAMEKEREEKRTVLFPVRLDDAVMESKTGWAADVRRTRHIGDFTRWKTHDPYQKVFTRLLRDLKADEKKC
jgi:hypothetical protein